VSELRKLPSINYVIQLWRLLFAKSA